MKYINIQYIKYKQTCFSCIPNVISENENKSAATKHFNSLNNAIIGKKVTGKNIKELNNEKVIGLVMHIWQCMTSFLKRQLGLGLFWGSESARYWVMYTCISLETCYYGTP